MDSIKKRIAISLHGFNVRDGGKSTTDYGLTFFRSAGILTRQDDYGYEDLIEVSLNNNKTKEYLQSLCQTYHRRGYEVTVLGHSNGACIAWMATETDDPTKSPDRILAVNPALKVDYPVGPFVKRIVVCYTEDDLATVFGSLWESVIPNWWDKYKPWGMMGRTGYKGNDPRVLNINANKIVGGRSLGHSGVFKPRNALIIFPKLIEVLYG